MTAAARCAACGGTGTEVVCVKGGYDHIACACGSVYLSPPAPADATEPTSEAHTPSFYALPAQMKVRWLQRVVRGGRLLEVGCGGGWFLTAAQRRGFEVAGIEPNRIRARRVSGRLGIDVECGLVEATRHADGAFDVVYNCDLLAHFPDPAQALAQMRRVLAPDGMLFLEVGLLGRFRRFWMNRMPEHAAPRHRWYFTADGLRRLLQRNGFEIERMRRFGLAAQALSDQVIWGVLGRLRRSHSATDAPAASPPLDPDAVHERQLLARYGNFMRYRLGAVMPSFPGPSTAFVLARREAGS